jgi:hypothetical protein
VGGLRRRLAALEQGTANGRPYRLGDAREPRVQVLQEMSDEELRDLEDLLEAAVECGVEDFWNLYAAASERSRRSLERYTEALEAARNRMGEEEVMPLASDMAKLAPSAEDPDYRNGYRIWKYYRKEKR